MNKSLCMVALEKESHWEWRRMNLRGNGVCWIDYKPFKQTGETDKKEKETKLYVHTVPLNQSHFTKNLKF